MKGLPAILNVVGLTMVLFALTMLIPTVVAFVGADAAQDAFVDGFLLALGIGGAIWLATRRFRGELRQRDGFLLVSLV